VIEYLIEGVKSEKLKGKSEKLVERSVKDFAEETSRESPAPGGGTIAAYLGALGAALGTMVANLSAHKAGWDDRWREFSDWAAKGQTLLARLLQLVDDDTEAFNRLMAAFQLPKKSEAEQAARAAAVEAATLHAAEVPLETMRTAMEVFPLCQAMASEGNPASVSDAGVGALAACAAVRGAALNVRINAKQLSDTAQAQQLVAEAQQLCDEAQRAERAVMEAVEAKL
jgi:glutamate formiminotransferase/formiminotetrahydrofolate cyclodeaminase